MTTSVNTQFHVAKELVDYTLGFEIYVDVYYNPATWDNTKYNTICGRGNNTGFPSGMFLPGAFGNIFFGKWKEGSLSQIATTGLTADWYRFSMIVTPTTFQIKLLNLRTNVELLGNVAAVGTSTAGEDKKFTFLCYGVDGVTGAYGSVGVNYSNIRISRGSTCLLNIPLSEGVGDKVTDVCNSSQYQITFFTTASGWAKLSNYFHWDFRYGFTLYQKSGSADLYVPNTTAQTEISITPPSGYTRVTNYKESRQTFNQCENVFVLDNTTPPSSVINAYFNQSGSYNYMGIFLENEVFYENGTYNGKVQYRAVSSANKTIKWETDQWAVYNFGTRQAYNTTNCATIDLVVYANWNAGYINSNSTMTKVVTPGSDLYNADVDHFLFTENTGVAKEIDLKLLNMASISDRGYLYYNETLRQSFMLYKTDKTLLNDVKIIKYIGMSSRIVYDKETGLPSYDENDHVELTEV